jgi:hypothetical protein
VRARQREIRKLMVEGRILPFGRPMAGTAEGPEPGFMGILPYMAVRALRGCALERPVQVAPLASGIRVCALQRKASQVVVDNDILPGRFVVAAGTILPKPASMSVIRVVALKTCHGGPGKARIPMAALALGLLMDTDQWEASQLVIEQCGFPCVGSMAGSAVLAQYPGMHVVLCVARDALLGGGPQIRSARRLHMASGAVDFGMCPIQHKPGLRMEEAATISIHTVVAGQTILSSPSHVGRECGGVEIPMAYCASLELEAQRGIPVTGGTSDPLSRNPLRMCRQSEPGHAVGEIRVVVAAQAGGFPAVLRVARLAVARIFNPTMHAPRVLQFQADLLVASQAAIAHRLRPPKGGVAGIAIRDIGVGVHPRPPQGRRRGRAACRG